MVKVLTLVTKIYLLGMVGTMVGFTTLAALPVQWKLNDPMRKYGIYGLIYTSLAWPYEVLYKWRNFVPNN